MKTNVAFALGDLLLIILGLIVFGLWGAVLVGAASSFGYIRADFGIPPIFSRDFWRGKNELS